MSERKLNLDSDLRREWDSFAERLNDLMFKYDYSITDVEFKLAVEDWFGNETFDAFYDWYLEGDDD